MIVKVFTMANDGSEVWVDSYIDDNKIHGFWIIPAYYDEDLDLTVDSDEMNIILNGQIMTIKIEHTLIELLKIRLG